MQGGALPRTPRPDSAWRSRGGGSRSLRAWPGPDCRTDMPLNDSLRSPVGGRRLLRNGSLIGPKLSPNLTRRLSDLLRDLIEYRRLFRVTVFAEQRRLFLPVSCDRGHSFEQRARCKRAPKRLKPLLPGEIRSAPSKHQGPGLATIFCKNLGVSSPSSAERAQPLSDGLHALTPQLERTAPAPRGAGLNR